MEPGKKKDNLPMDAPPTYSSEQKKKDNLPMDAPPTYSSEQKKKDNLPMGAPPAYSSEQKNLPMCALPAYSSEQTATTARLPPQTGLPNPTELPPQTVLPNPTAELPPQTGLPDLTPTAEQSPLSPAQQQQLQTIIRIITAQRAVAVQRAVPVQQAVPVQRAVGQSSRGGIIGGTARYRNGVLVSINYTYADELPCIRNTMLVFVVLCFFIGTPISLLCTIPAFYFIKKSNDKANRDRDIPAARDSYCCYKVSLYGLTTWFTLIFLAVVILSTLRGVGAL